LKNGDRTLTDEYLLSESPLKVDMMVIKKNRDVTVERDWGRAFREHNVIIAKKNKKSP
jgi:hypothetical protein